MVFMLVIAVRGLAVAGFVSIATLKRGSTTRKQKKETNKARNRKHVSWKFEEGQRKGNKARERKKRKKRLNEIIEENGGRKETEDNNGETNNICANLNKKKTIKICKQANERSIVKIGIKLKTND